MSLIGNPALNEQIEIDLNVSKSARSKLSKHKVMFYGNEIPSTSGKLFINFANMIVNRNIDLFDDAIFLIDAERFSSACIVARCVMETHAIGLYAWDEIGKHLTNTGLSGIGDKVLKFINSSKFKVDEQKGLKAGKFEIKEFHFTEEARCRMESEAAQSVHVLNAMRLLFGIELKNSKKKESNYELIYNALSEWVHPSQTSLFHKYAINMPKIETSIGNVSVRDGAINHCVLGLSLIQSSSVLHRDMLAFGKHLHEREIADGRQNK